MDKAIVEIQSKVLQTVSGDENFGFALAGGTALERYYLHHRLSRDLDFFSPRYDPAGAERSIKKIEEQTGCRAKKEQELFSENRARAIFYSLTGKGLKRPLKVDFVEDVLINKATIARIDGVPVYGVRDIYFHKIAAVAGTGERRDATGRVLATGRDEPRDAFDLYVLSTRIEPMGSFLQTIPSMYQKSFIRWVRTYSRMDLKIGLLDLDICLEGFDAREMIRHFDDQAEKFIKALV